MCLQWSVKNSYTKKISNPYLVHCFVLANVLSMLASFLTECYINLEKIMIKLELRLMNLLSVILSGSTLSSQCIMV